MHYSNYCYCNTIASFELATYYNIALYLLMDDAHSGHKYIASFVSNPPIWWLHSRLSPSPSASMHDAIMYVVHLSDIMTYIEFGCIEYLIIYCQYFMRYNNIWCICIIKIIVQYHESHHMTEQYSLLWSMTSTILGNYTTADYKIINGLFKSIQCNNCY